MSESALQKAIRGLKTDPEVAAAIRRGRARREAIDAARKVRSDCGMDLNDAALVRLVDAVINAYQENV